MNVYAQYAVHALVAAGTLVFSSPSARRACHAEGEPALAAEVDVAHDARVAPLRGASPLRPAAFSSVLLRAFSSARCWTVPSTVPAALLSSRRVAGFLNDLR